MLLPIFGIFALFALTGCGREEERTPATKKSVPCPKGWDDKPVSIEHNEIHLCRSTQDGKVHDAVTVGDRFVRAEENDFNLYREKFFLPNLEGLNLNLWQEAHRQIFPQGASKQGMERFRSLTNYFQEKNLALGSVLAAAKKIPWFNERSAPATWQEIAPPERLDALALSGMLRVLQAEKNDVPADQRFIDTVLQAVESRQLKLQKQTLLKDQSLNRLTELTGRESSAGYMRDRNTLLLGIPLDPASLHSVSSYLHELYHFYQDASKQSASFLQTEFTAYVQQGEFVVQSLRSPTYRQRYQDVEDYIQKEYTQKNHNPDQPATWAIRYAQARLENNSEAAEKYQNAVLESIDKLYYSRLFLSHTALEVGKKAAGFTNLTLATSQGSSDQVLEKMETELHQAREQSKAAFQELTERLGQTNPDTLTKSQEQELEQKFRQALLASTYTIVLEEYRDRTAAGNLDPITHLEMNLDGPKYQELYRTMAKYHPLQYQRIEMNGVDTGGG